MATWHNKDKRKVCSFIGKLCSTDKVSLAWKKNWVNSVARLLAQYINILADYKMRKGKTKTQSVFSVVFTASYGHWRARRSLMWIIAGYFSLYLKSVPDGTWSTGNFLKESFCRDFFAIFFLLSWYVFLSLQQNRVAHILLQTQTLICALKNTSLFFHSHFLSFIHSQKM